MYVKRSEEQKRFCPDCKHFFAGNEYVGVSEPVCFNDKYRQLTGRHIGVEEARYNGSMCGIEGHGFEEKEPEISLWKMFKQKLREKFGKPC